MGLIGKIFARATPVEADVEARGFVQAEYGLAGLEEALGGPGLTETVGTLEAMSSPAIWAAINFLSGTMAGLPLAAFDKVEGGSDVRIKGPISGLLADAVNDDLTSFSWRETFFGDVFSEGRGYSYIERDKSGTPINIFPMEYNRTTVRKVRGKRIYSYRDGDGRTQVYDAGDVIDIAYLMKPCGVQNYSPIKMCQGAIRQALNANKYALTVFGKNGVPPYVLKGPFRAAKEAARAAMDLMKATRRASEEGKPILPLPDGMDLTRLGDDPDKMQLTLVQRFSVEQAARIYQMPPMFLQDLSKGNFANTEQQDLHLVKHTLRRWVEKSEAELTLKLFGRNAGRCVKYDLDGLLRGDFQTRMQGSATGVQNGLLTPNEARELEGRAAMPGGDQLMIQGATVPISEAGRKPGGDVSE